MEDEVEDVAEAEVDESGLVGEDWSAPRDAAGESAFGAGVDLGSEGDAIGVSEDGV